jgi:hypothetical protein
MCAPAVDRRRAKDDKETRMRRLLTRARIWMLSMSAGGSVLVLESCDPNVRETVLGGVGSAATSLAGTFIGAFIESLQGEEESAVQTVRAIIEHVPQLLA